jgi:riboflavin kinase/FMN adenylyltransferase
MRQAGRGAGTFWESAAWKAGFCVLTRLWQNIDEMITFNDLESINDIGGTAVAMGNFDGMHLGHLELIRATVARAAEKRLKSAVFTFSEHPRNAIEGPGTIKNIMYPGEKAEAIERLGVDYLFSVPFSHDIQHMAPRDFVQRLLLGRFRAAEASCGFNYRFGFRAEGSTKTLVELGDEMGFSVSVLEALEVKGRVVSSSLIRQLIAEGDMEECAVCLGRRYSVGGEVVVGNRIGRSIGFPTVNILMDDEMAAPSHGVYVTNCHLGGHTFAGVTNVGVRPTIGDEKKSIETHLFDFCSDLYGKTIRVEFLKKLRDERRFPGMGELAAQIRRDSRAAAEYHAKLRRGV